MSHFKVRLKWFKHHRRIGGILTILCLGFPLSARAQFRPDRPDFFEEGRDRFEQELERFQKPDSVPTLDIDIQSSQWSAVFLRKGEAVVWMPQGVVTHETKTVENVRGDIEFDVISSRSSLGEFVIAFSDSVDYVADTDAGELLVRVRNHIVGEQTGFGAVGDRNIVFKEYPGRDFTLKNEQEVIAFRVLWVQSRLYVMAVSQSADSQSQEAIATFFKSFQLLDQSSN